MKKETLQKWYSFFYIVSLIVLATDIVILPIYIWYVHLTKEQMKIAGKLYFWMIIISIILGGISYLIKKVYDRR